MKVYLYTYHKLYGIWKQKVPWWSLHHLQSYLIFNAAVCSKSIASGGANLQPLLLRVRRALDYQDMPWQLRYIGQPEIGELLQIKLSSVICFICLLLCMQWWSTACESYILVYGKDMVKWVEQLRALCIMARMVLVNCVMLVSWLYMLFGTINTKFTEILPLCCWPTARHFMNCEITGFHSSVTVNLGLLACRIVSLR